MLVDKITISAKAGKGGDGVVRWRQEKFVAKGGPWGGDGGKGGDVYLKAVRDIYKLKSYDANKEYKAEDGQPGGTKLMTGKGGEDLYLEVPVGSIVYSKEYDKSWSLNEEGQIEKILTGGKGGYGNNHFKSSTNRSPEEFTPGKIGEVSTLKIEVEMIADIGLIGFPNAGKSTLLNELTRAHAKTANYAFTTLEPNLGDFHGYVIADLPGLIEGAAEGKGLGHKFLKHIKRTGLLMHLISSENSSVTDAYNSILKELGDFDKTLLEKDQICLLTKSDMVSKEEAENKANEIKKITGGNVYIISSYDDKSIMELSERLSNLLQKK